MNIRIAIAEDNPMTRSQYEQRFSLYDHIEIVKMAENGEQLLKQLSKIPAEKLPQIVLMDIEMPVLSGIETTVKLKQLYPDMEVMMLTVFKEEDKIFESIRAGASGYLLKDSDTETILSAIQHLQEGGVPLSKSIARKVLQILQQDIEVKKLYQKEENQQKDFNLTKREIEILEAIIRDDTEYAIAKELNISEHTVRTHVKNIYKKLHVHSRGAVVKAVYVHNLLRKDTSEKD